MAKMTDEELEAFSEGTKFAFYDMQRDARGVYISPTRKICEAFNKGYDQQKIAQNDGGSLY